jgi:hypothetical protein
MVFRVKSNFQSNIFSSSVLELGIGEAILLIALSKNVPDYKGGPEKTKKYKRLVKCY